MLMQFKNIDQLNTLSSFKTNLLLIRWMILHLYFQGSSIFQDIIDKWKWPQFLEMGRVLTLAQMQGITRLMEQTNVTYRLHLKSTSKVNKFHESDFTTITLV